ncbi:MAG: hypothetical protein ACOC33_00495 [bacterium]
MKKLIYDQKKLTILGVLFFLIMIISGGNDFFTAPLIGKVSFVFFIIIVFWTTIGIAIINKFRK